MALGGRRPTPGPMGCFGIGHLSGRRGDHFIGTPVTDLKQKHSNLHCCMDNEGIFMERFTKAIKMAIENKNWYGALTMALALPDICGHIEAPKQGSKDRYVDWYNRYMLKKYTSYLGPDKEEHIFLRGEDCYALRCSYLHQGGSNIENQKARQALSDFLFIGPPESGGLIHLNQFNKALQLQVDIFCLDMANSVEEWAKIEVQNNEEYQNKINSELIVIHDGSKGLSF